MQDFRVLAGELRKAEQQLEQQLHGVRAAISSLESGGAVLPTMRRRSVSAPNGVVVVRKRRKLSAAARKAISDAQKKRWAKQKAQTKK